MIERKIHYIWLGSKDTPERFQTFLKSWRDTHPDWEIIKWNEENFDCNCNPWIKAAIEHKKWNLASDIMRIYILLEHGGVYLDTDMELIKPLNELVAGNDFFIGFETDLWFGTAVLAAKKDHRIMREALNRYLAPLKKMDNHSNMLTVLNFCASIKRLYNIKNKKLNGKTQKIGDNAILLSRDYFFAKHYLTRKTKITPITLAIHHYSSAWFSPGKRFGIYIARAVYIILGQRIFSNLFERIARIYMLGKLDREYKKNNRNQ